MKKKSSNFLIVSVFGIMVLIESLLLSTLIENKDVNAAGNPIVQVVNIAEVLDGAHQTSVTPTAGTTKTIYVSGYITDPNGYLDISSATLVFRRSDLVLGCSANDNNCYIDSVCTLSSVPKLNRKHYDCQVDITWFADPTDTGSPYASLNWKARVRAYDTAGNVGGLTNTTEMNSVVAMSDSPNNINFGTLDIGQSASLNILHDLFNTGNRAINTYFSMPTAMTCSGGGTIPATAIVYDLLSDTPSSYTATLGNILTTTQTLAGGPLNKSLCNSNNAGCSPTVDKRSTFWNITAPPATKGNCSGNINIDIQAL